MLRREKFPEYQVLQAPFYFKQGDALASYIESNLDEMNQLKPLQQPEDPDDPDFDEEAEDEGQIDLNQKDVQSANGGEASAQKDHEEKSAAAKDEDEPKIEDVIDSSSVPPNPDTKKTDLSNMLNQE